MQACSSSDPCVARAARYRGEHPPSRPAVKLPCLTLAAVQYVAVDDVGDPFDAAQLEPGVQPELKQQPDRMLQLAGAQEAGGRG